MLRSTQFLTLTLSALAGCARPTQPPGDELPDSGFTDGSPDGPDVLQCPGETQCPPPCPAGLILGPTGLCTTSCAVDTDCHSGVGGEACIASMCGVPCDPTKLTGGCAQAGIHGGVCRSIGKPITWVCGTPSDD